MSKIKNNFNFLSIIVASRQSTSPIPPPSTGGTLPRPGTKQVTVTVQETVVEPAQAQQQIPVAAPVVRHQHHASSATKELDDLMASLSDFKVRHLCIHPKIYLIDLILEAYRLINIHLSSSSLKVVEDSV